MMGGDPFGNDPFFGGQMSLFGGGGGGGNGSNGRSRSGRRQSGHPFGGMMEQMMQQMGSMQAMDPWGGIGRGGILGGDISLIPDGGGGDGHMQSYCASFSSMSDGKGGQRVVEHSRQMRKAPGQVAEVKEHRKDSHAGVSDMAVQRQIGRRAMKVSRSHNLRTNDQQQHRQLLNMSEQEAKGFDQGWSSASRALPSQAQWAAGGQLGGGRGAASVGMGPYFGGAPPESASSNRGAIQGNPVHDHRAGRRNKPLSIPLRRAPDLGTPGRDSSRSNRSNRNMLAIQH